MSDLDPDVRDRAIAAVEAVLFDWSVDDEAGVAPPVVDAVAEVLAAQSAALPCDERCSEAHSYDEGCVLTVSYSEPSEEVQALSELVAPVMRAWTLDSPFHDSAPRQVAEALLVAGYMHVAERDALKARVAELSTEHLHLSHEVEALEEWNFWLSRTLRDMARRATSLRRLTDFAVTAPEPRTDRDALKARVDLLTTALTEIVAANDASTDQLPRSMWPSLTRARAALSATPTENEAP